ncbi:A24 family peptidase [Onishia taeanensis]
MIEAISLIALVLVASLFDVYQRRIPNLLIMAGAAMGILLQGMLAGPSGVLAALFGLGVGLAVLLPGYLMGFTGAGDVKLMAAVGGFLGVKGVLMAAIFSIGVGGMIALGYAASSLIAGTSLGPWGRYSLMFQTLMTTGKPIYIPPVEGEVMGKKFPFAVSIALGACGYLVWTYMH